MLDKADGILQNREAEIKQSILSKGYNLSNLTKGSFQK